MCDLSLIRTLRKLEVILFGWGRGGAEGKEGTFRGCQLAWERELMWRGGGDCRRGDHKCSNIAVSPPSPSVCKHRLYRRGPVACFLFLCFLSHAFFVSCILTFSRSSLSFPSLLLCHSHSSGGATLKGKYGQPCLTRERPGSFFDVYDLGPKWGQSTSR